MNKRSWIAAGLGVLGLAFGGLALAQVYPPPQVTSIGPTDLFQDVVGGAAVTGNVYANALQVGTYGQTLAGGNPENILVGGDMGTNLFQDGASVGSITTTITYTADQWAAWSGAATTLTVTQQTGATDITAGFTASLRVNKGSGAGVVPACILQEVLSADSVRFQGTTAEFDFHAKAGPNFSAASSNLNVSIVYGTGTDEGVSKLAFAFNAGGGGSSTWTGQANAAANLAVPINTSWNRYSVVAPIPATATELAVIICYTPVGTGVAGDWYEFTGAQLVRNPALTTVAGAAGAVLTANDTRAKSFSRRLNADEARLQYNYYYRINESATVLNIRASCGISTASIANCLVPFPGPMRVAPTMTYTAGFEASATTASTSATVCTGLTTSATLTGSAASTTSVLVNCASSGGFGAAGTTAFLWDIGTGSATGVIKASARF
jgi:hypothetical protein